MNRVFGLAKKRGLFTRNPVIEASEVYCRAARGGHGGRRSSSSPCYAAC